MALTPKRWNADVAVAVIATVVMMALSFAAAPGSTYRFSFLFLAPIIWLAYAARKRLHLRPVHLALIASALVLHNLGVFGWYRREFWTLQFDTYVHFYFGVVGGFIVRAGLEGAYGLRTWRLWVAVILGILGMGAIHELIEWASTMILGPERGMLKTLADDPYDTQKDLMNNFLGTVLSLLCSWLLKCVRQSTRSEPHARPASSSAR
ncbi:MAG TPA: DUF2238 domain-containing protein [Candidatus Acidoferrum sp.]|nr:DUF2238 domain-containing protein [Candidatus Acidoferrum sp.]